MLGSILLVLGLACSLVSWVALLGPRVRHSESDNGRWLSPRRGLLLSYLAAVLIVTGIFILASSGALQSVMNQ